MNPASPSPAAPSPASPSPAAAALPAPLRVFTQFHRQALRHGAALRRLVAYLNESGFDRQAQVLSHVVLTFFDVQAPLYLSDEEQELFPALADSTSGSDPAALREMVTGAAADHQALASLWERLRTRLEAMEAGHSAELPVQDVESFVRLWSEHVGREQGELLAMAPQLVTTPRMERMARSMRERWQ